MVDTVMRILLVVVDTAEDGCPLAVTADVLERRERMKIVLLEQLKISLDLCRQRQLTIIVRVVNVPVTAVLLTVASGWKMEGDVLQTQIANLTIAIVNL